MKRLTFLFLLMGLVFSQAVGQKYSVDNKNSKLEVLGTSTLHDWEILAEDMSGTADISFENNELEVSILKFQVKVESLKSGKSSMDKNTYEALKSEKHPLITYELKTINKKSGSGKALNLNTSGTLTIAGFSKAIEMPVSALITGNQVSFTGKITFKMTDFKVDPPTALMGTIKTGDEITVQFNVTYKNN